MGWKVPYDGPVDPNFRISRGNSPGTLTPGQQPSLSTPAQQPPPQKPVAATPAAVPQKPIVTAATFEQQKKAMEEKMLTADRATKRKLEEQKQRLEEMQRKKSMQDAS